MAAKIFMFVLMMTVGCAFTTLPEYFHVCHRNDPEVSKCIIQSMEVLRPGFRDGLPELQVPSIEPLNLPEIAFSGRTPFNFRGISKNVKLFGLSNFQVTKLKSDISNTTFYIGVKFPYLKTLADVDVKLKFFIVPIKGRGILEIIATNVHGNVILKGEITKDDGVEKMLFKTVDLDLQVEDIDVRVNNIFRGDAVLGTTINQALNENKKNIFKGMKAIAEKTVSDILLDLFNNIVKNFSYSEVFPE